MQSTEMDIFTQAISLQQSNKPDEALQLYQNSLDKSPTELTPEQASVISYNIAVIYHQQQKHELSYVFNEKALALNLSNKSAVQLKAEILKNFKPVEVAREMTSLEQVHNLGLKFVSIEIIFALTIVFALASFKQIFNLLVLTKKSNIEETHPPKVSIKTYLLWFFSLVLVALLFLKISYNSEIRGIIKSAGPVQTAPGPNQATIIEASLASTVYILQTKAIDGVDYVQIKVPGSYSGWIKKQDVELLNSLQWP